jgi:mannose-6-phosphate isomerase-like protein (cupin superfamily)
MQIEQPKKHRHAFSFTAQRREAKTDLAISNAQSEGRYTMQDELWPADFVVPAHFHDRHSELFYVVSGQVEWTVNGETHVMGAGDMVFIPPGTPHAVKTVGGKEARMLMLYEPGGYEDTELRESMFTAEQRKDPKIAETLRKLGDFHITTMPAAAK